MVELLLSFSLYCAVMTNKCTVITPTPTQVVWAICDSNLTENKDLKLIVGDKDTETVKNLTITFKCQEV